MNNCESEEIVEAANIAISNLLPTKSRSLYDIAYNRTGDGYQAKKLTKSEIDRFLSSADDKEFLMIKVGLILGIAGACRTDELVNLTVDDIEDVGSSLIVKIPNTKTKIPRIFVVTDVGNMLELFRKYLSLRPPHVKHKRLFLYYKAGKCSSQPVGKNTMGKIPSVVASYLKLPDVACYTGHCLRRSSATLLADAGVDITTIKRHAGWKSKTVAEGYVENSIENKTKIANQVLKLKRKVLEYIIISEENPNSHLHFKSETLLREEKIRQLKTVGCILIHPFSKLRKWYDIYIIFLYISLLLTKPLQGCFFSTSQLTGFVEYTLITDLLSWIDIAMHFLTGFYVERMNTVELRPSVVTRKYICSIYFLSDLISSVPASLFVGHHSMDPTKPSIRNGIIRIMCLFKVARFVSPLVYIYKFARTSKTMYRYHIICNILILVLIGHWIACIQFGVSKLRFNFLPETRNKTWISYANLRGKHIGTHYVHSFFKSSAYIIGIRIRSHQYEVLPEEYILAILTYILGKFLVMFTWIHLALIILNSRSTNIKFAELINQLEEYFKQKGLPFNLRNRILYYYHFKYQKQYMNENKVKSLLSNNLKKELKLHECGSSLRTVALMAALSPREISKLSECLVLEIFLPNDRVYSSGTYGDAMYFLSSGTVAVYTHSGKEVCHLQDGSYFGEVSLVVPRQPRLATIIAIEPCHVYKLSRKDFELCLLRNKTVMEKMVRSAENKLNIFKNADEKYTAEIRRNQDDCSEGKELDGFTEASRGREDDKIVWFNRSKVDKEVEVHEK
ncbi:hypothetical protein NQ317_016338 [Molorchus minor]|uniref:Cyclic nucleotide-binding domain-containing protein n=1 Tax=Molorchus minor TaxID=1323400 RepID=A0ABQ9J261_9CUCU|nr:hypothetical protein NQ317_016338 [Molorchus minor]